MSVSILSEIYRSGSIVLLLLLIAGTIVTAEQLPVKTYTTADGLLRNEVNRIKQDSRGFLWFCTNDGLSRFDGYGFTNYTTDDGLPHRVVNDVLETRDGKIWIATSNGLTSFNPKGKRGFSDTIRNPQSAIRNSDEPMFVAYLPEGDDNRKRLTVLFEDAQGKLWCGTGDGLYWYEERDAKVIFHRVDMPKGKSDRYSEVSAIIQDRRGSIWIGMDAEQGLNRIGSDGRIEHYVTSHSGGESKSIKTLFETKEGEIWVGTSDGGLCSLVSEPDPRRPILSRCYTRRDGLPIHWVQTLYQTADGTLWIGTTNGLASLASGPSSSPQFRIYRAAQGLCDEGTWALAEDRDSNLWVATSCGVKKIVRSSFVRYTEDDGLTTQNVNSIFLSHTDELFIITKQTVESPDRKTLRASHLINRFDGNRFASVKPNLPAYAETGWGGGQIVAQDRGGQWWLPSDKRAVFRFSKFGKLEQLSSAKPQAISIPDREIFRLYEDLRGDVWISTMYQQLLLRQERSTETIHDYSDKSHGAASCFAEDKNADLWIGFFYDDKLARYRDGRLMVFGTNGEKPGGRINSLYFDRAGRLWLASSLNGVGRVDEPSVGEQLSVVWYDRRKGLSTDATLSLTEDNFGRIYVGHARGVDRIDPNTEQIKHYTAADGLPQGMIQFAGRDKQGSLWFGWRGLARLIPEPDKPRQPPNILLTGLRIAGEKLPVSELGEETLSELTLESSQRQVSVDFLGLGASLGEELKYRYRLEGAQGDWSEPTTQRTVDFASLAPGSYRLMVKAISAEGTESAKPAGFTFTILPPIWQRWWFLSMVASLLVVMLFALYRYRVARLLELERIRTRIASDLHDDIGSNLSLIAMVSDAARRQVPPENLQMGDWLYLIADTSREMVDAMSDIVWAVNPNKDWMHDLVHRMRRAADDIFSVRQIEFRFSVVGQERDVKLGVDTRRELFMIFKEGINNITRHSHCTKAEIEFQVEENRLQLRLSDNGRGFNVAEAIDGNGMVSMRRRAQKLGGRLEVISSPGTGTTVILKAPLDRHRRR
jgi:ligand-binding sensor domain-containing protein/two-component sensor histidine kinase